MKSTKKYPEAYSPEFTVIRCGESLQNEGFTLQLKGLMNPRRHFVEARRFTFSKGPHEDCASMGWYLQEMWCFLGFFLTYWNKPNKKKHGNKNTTTPFRRPFKPWQFMSRGGCSCPRFFHDFGGVSKTKRVGRNTKITAVCLFGPRVTYVFLFFGTLHVFLGHCTQGVGSGLVAFFSWKGRWVNLHWRLGRKRYSAKQANLWTVWGITYLVNPIYIYV